MEKVAAMLLNRLEPTRFDPSLVCFDPRNGALDCVDKDRVPTHIIEKRNGVDPMLWLRLYRHFRRTKPAIIHTFNEGALIYAYPAAKAAGVGAVVHAEHGRLAQDEGALLRKMRVHMTRNSTCVVAVSDAICDVLRAEGVEAPKIVKIINGIDTDEFGSHVNRQKIRSKLGIEVDDWVAGTVGSLTPQKNHELLIRAVSNCPDVTAVIAGAGELDSQLQALADSLGVADRVRFIGRTDNVPEFLDALDVFVLPSRTEGTSLALLEAMASRLAVVATSVGGNPNVVEDGVTGILTPSEDVGALIKALAELKGDSEKRRAMGERGRERVKEHYDFEKTVKEYESLFLNAAGRP
ncbi:MAG: glycosyltransferase [Woeseiaceae bacterium]|nr:glycosyltransferase [Woeseiaceae bacterium]